MGIIKKIFIIFVMVIITICFSFSASASSDFQWYLLESREKEIYLTSYKYGWEEGNSFAQDRAQEIKNATDHEISDVGKTSFRKLYKDYVHIKQESLFYKESNKRLMLIIDQIYAKEKYKIIPVELVLRNLVMSESLASLYDKLDNELLSLTETPVGDI